MNKEIKAKILQIGRFSPPLHGASKMNELYFKELNKKPWVTLKKIKVNFSKNIDNLEKFSLVKVFGVFYTSLELIIKIIFFRPRIIYFEIAPSGFSFLRDSFFVWICKIFGKKVFLHFHARGIKDSTKNSLKKWYYKTTFRGLKIIILSKILFEDLEDIVNYKDVFILPNGLEDEVAEEEFKNVVSFRKKNATVNLLFLSNMIKSKGPLDVIEVCRLLKDEGLKFNCNFAGGWKDKATKNEFYRKIKTHGLEKYCQYLGPVYDKDKANLLKSSNFLIFPTKYEKERFPLVIIEAFMYGIPVVSYDNGAINEMINKNYLGYVTKEPKPKLIYKWLKENLNTEPNYYKIREEFNQKYKSSTAGQKLIEILTS